MIAEAPLALAMGFMPAGRREALVDFLFGTPLAGIAAVVVAVGFGVFVGWIGHRLGLGASRASG